MNVFVLNPMAVSVPLTNEKHKTQIVTERYKFNRGNLSYIPMSTAVRKKEKEIEISTNIFIIYINNICS